MAKIKVMGDAAILTSAIAASVLKDLKKYKPQALKLIDAETKDELFAVCILEGGNASASKFGVTYTSSDAEGKATATFTIPSNLSAEAKQKYVKDTFGQVILNINKIESAIQDAAADLVAEFETIDAAIEIL